MFATDRVFEKRETPNGTWSGRVGSASLEMSIEGDHIVAKLDGKTLPDASVTYLLNFSLQSLQDAYAGAESLDEAVGNWTKKRDALLAGSIGVRSGEGVSTFMSVARQIVRALLKKKYGPKSQEWTAFTGLEDKAQNEKLDAAFEANKDALTPAVEAEIARRKEEAAKKRDIMGSISL